MFTRARLHLTLIYAALLSLTVVLLAGAIGYLSVREARATNDRELQLRATAVARAVPQNPPPAPTGPPPFDRGGSNPDDHGPPHLEEQGLLEYTMPVSNGSVLPPPDSTLPGLPDVPAAQRALQTGKPLYATETVEGNAVRIYSLPVVRSGQVVTVVQIARSQYFVNAAVTQIAVISLVAGVVGLIVSSAASYWLAGRTLRPIAVSLERQRDFAADASHELRTPLTVMLTNAELLTHHPERSLAEYQDVVEDIIAEIERLSRLVTDLLTLARADQGKISVARDPVDLSEVGAAVVRQFAPIAAQKGIDLQTEAESGVTVAGDQDRLHQLAVILVDNAVRYTDKGSVTVRVRREGGNGVLAVSDTGRGIAPEHLPHLFDRFYRTDDARSAEEGGTGLGLALASWIVSSHHGHVDVTSEPGKGSTFSVRLPQRS